MRRASTMAWGWLALMVLAGCTVKNANDPSQVEAGAPATGSNAATATPAARCDSQDACMQRCKAAAPDEASRQPCYNDCMRACQ